MKKTKKVLAIILVYSFLLVGLLPIQASAAGINSLESTISSSDTNSSESILDELSKVLGMKKLVKDLKENGELKAKQEVYVKIYDDVTPAKEINNTYTHDEYVNECKKEVINQSYSQRTLSTTSTSTPYDYGWVKLTYEIYDNAYAIPAGQFTIIAEFEWQKIPLFQGKDIFSIGHDNNSVFYNERTRFVYFPNTDTPQYSAFYNNIGVNYLSKAYSYTNASGIYFNLLDNSKVSDSAFNVNADTNKISLKGKPKGFLTCFGRRANSTSYATNLCLLYGHQQIIIDFKPSLSVGSSGSISIGGISGKVAYDCKSPAFAYDYGTSVFKP
jgi:ribosomal protein S24E